MLRTIRNAVISMALVGMTVQASAGQFIYSTGEIRDMCKGNMQSPRLEGYIIGLFDSTNSQIDFYTKDGEEYVTLGNVANLCVPSEMFLITIVSSVCSQILNTKNPERAAALTIPFALRKAFPCDK